MGHIVVLVGGSRRNIGNVAGPGIVHGLSLSFEFEKKGAQEISIFLRATILVLRISLSLEVYFRQLNIPCVIIARHRPVSCIIVVKIGYV